MWRRAYQPIVEFSIKSSVQIRPVGHFSWFGTRWLRLVLVLVMGAVWDWLNWLERSGSHKREKYEI